MAECWMHGSDRHGPPPVETPSNPSITARTERVPRRGRLAVACFTDTGSWTRRRAPVQALPYSGDVDLPHVGPLDEHGHDALGAVEDVGQLAAHLQAD